MNLEINVSPWLLFVYFKLNPLVFIARGFKNEKNYDDLEVIQGGVSNIFKDCLNFILSFTVKFLTKFFVKS